MALNKSFVGNVVDEAGTAIDCNIRGYHVEQNKWNDWKATSSQYYNINLGDGDWIGQDGSTGQTDRIVLVFETTETDPLDRKFAVYEFQMDGSDVYDVDVQLKPCLAPIVSTLWQLNSPTDGTTTFANADDGGVATYVGRINEAIAVVETFTDEKDWTYGSITMKHQIAVYGTDVFADRLGVQTKEFDWTEDDSFVTNTDHTYTVISQTTGDKSQEVEAKITNKKGLITNDVLKLQIRYNTPVADLTFSPVTPSVQDTFQVTGACTDVDSRVTAISWKYDGTEVANNTTLNYQWTQDLGTNYVSAGHDVNGDVTWSDGFNSFTIVHGEHVTMTNLAPTFTLTDEVVGAPEDNRVRFTLSGLDDPDGDNNNIEARWKVEYKTPFDNNWVTVKNDGYPNPKDLDPKEWIFETAGDYRITAVVKDGFGLETEHFIEKTFASGSNCEGSGKIRLNTKSGGNRWQLISVPVKNKKVKEYFLDWIDTKIKTYDSAKSVNDVVEVVNAYPGNVGKFLTFVPGSTPVGSEGNFNLVIEDGTNIFEILGFWVKIKDYMSITGGVPLDFEWNMADA